jgi:hypothetical protein
MDPSYRSSLNWGCGEDEEGRRVHPVERAWLHVQRLPEIPNAPEWSAAPSARFLGSNALGESEDPMRVMRARLP